MDRSSVVFNYIIQRSHGALNASTGAQLSKILITRNIAREFIRAERDIGK